MIKIFVLCKNEIFFKSVQSLLEPNNISIIQMCTEPKKAVNKFIHSKADMVIMDANWADCKFSCNEILHCFLEHNKGLKVIVVTTFFEKYISKQVAQRGAKGYFYKNGDRFENIITCIEKVFSGENCFARE